MPNDQFSVTCTYIWRNGLLCNLSEISSDLQGKQLRFLSHNPLIQTTVQTVVNIGCKNGVLSLKLLMGSRFYCSAFCHVIYKLCPMLITVDHMLRTSCW